MRTLTDCPVEGRLGGRHLSTSGERTDQTQVLKHYCHPVAIYTLYSTLNKILIHIISDYGGINFHFYELNET